MTLTKKQKWYLGVLAIALAVLAVDNLTGGEGPAESRAASAAPLQPIKAPVAVQPSQDKTTSPTTQPRVAMADQLDRMTSGLELAATVDAFAIPQSWLAAEQAKVDAQSENAPPTFAERHVLTAVVTGARGMAIVNGKSVRIGQTIEGYRLLSVDTRTARFANDRETVVLKVKPTG